VKNDVATRARILRAGQHLFAERGFKRVTIRDICREAGANVAAVNYHFGDKRGLYREVLQTAIDAMRATSEQAREAGRGQRPEVQLRRYLEVFLSRILKPGSEEVHRLIHREMTDPTPAFDALVEQGVRPRVEYLSGLIVQMIGGSPRDQRVLRCVSAIQAQALAYIPNPVAMRLGLAFAPTPAQIRKAA